MTRLKKLPILALLLLILSALPATATPPFQGVDRQHYPEAHAVLAAEYEERDYKSDGSCLSSDEVYLKILDEEGKRRHQVLSFYINLAYSRLDIEFCEIIRAGRHLAIDVEVNCRREASAANSRANIYNSREKTLKLFIPGLEIGDIVHYRLRRDQFKPIISRQIYGQVLAQYDIPIKFYQLTVEAPAAKEINWLIKDEIQPAVAYEEIKLPGSQARILRRWHFTDVAQIVPEEHMPSFRRVAMRLLYSSLENWGQIATWYADLVEPRLTAGKELASFTKKLCADLSRDEKIAALFYFVARQIRYLGVNGEDERPGFEPHDVNLTFNRRHGVCRDKAALLVTMLRQAGCTAMPVLIRVGDRLDPEIALPYFNHAIVAVKTAAGSLLLLDPTAETTRQFLPDYERECSYLPADPQSTTLLTTPAPDPAANLTQIVIDSRYHDNGRISGHLQVDCHGFSDALLRSIMMNLSFAERKNFLGAYFLGHRPGLELQELDFSDPADRSRNFSFRGTFNLMPSDKGSIIPLIHMSDPGPLEHRLLSRAKLSRRRFPLDLGYTLATEIVENASWASATSPPAPVSIKIDNPVFSFSLTSKNPAAGKIASRRLLTLKQTEIRAEDYHFLINWQSISRRLARDLPLNLGKQESQN